jgi:hypothetical protein
MSNLYQNTLQSVVNLASTHADLLPLAGVGGYTNEPALSLCNDALSDLLFSEIDWKFNRVEMPMMVTAQNKQDYLVAGAVAFTLGSTSTGAHIGLSTTPAITVATAVVTVNTLEAHRFNVGDTVYLNGVTMTTGTSSKYNSVFTDNGSTSTWSNGWVIASTPTTTSFTFAATSGQSNADAGGAPGITDFGWLASASLKQLNDTSSPQDGRIIQAVKELAVWQRVANPEKVCVLKDNGDGTLKIRFWYTPGSVIWIANLVYQAKAPLKTSLANDWSPFPDHYSAVYRQALLARMYRYLNSSQQTVEFQKLQAEIAKANGAEDRETTDVHLVPEDSLGVSDNWAGW